MKRNQSKHSTNHKEKKTRKKITVRIERKDVLCRILPMTSRNSLLDDKKFTDCSFLVGEEEPEIIHGHKNVLATASEVFEAMLCGNLAETRFPIAVPDITPGGFRAMIQHIYRSAAPLSSMDDLCQLWVASHKYALNDLFAKCEEEITKRMKPENVCHVLDYAIHFDSNYITTSCTDLIRQSPQAIFESETFVEVSLQALTHILGLTELRIAELALFNAVMRWSRAQCQKKGLTETRENLRLVCKGPFEKIRFLSMSLFDFSHGPAISPMLTKDEIFGIFLSLSEPQRAGTLGPYPDLCKIWYTRNVNETFVNHTTSDDDESATGGEGDAEAFQEERSWNSTHSYYPSEDEFGYVEIM